MTFKNLEMSKRVRKNSYTISNSITNDLAIILVENKDIYAYLSDSNFKVNSTQFIKTKNIKSKYNKVLGFSIKQNNYHVLYTNDSRNKFSILKLDFNNFSGESIEVDLNLDNDLFLDAINYKNKLYILSANSDSILNLRVYNNEGFDLVKSFELEEIKDETNLISTKFQYGLFMFSGKEKTNITKIEQRVFNSIEQTSAKNKMYQNDQSIYLTFDVNEVATHLYKIDLEQLNLDYKIYPYPKSKSHEFKNYNSFIFENNIYQIASSKETLKFVISDFDSKVIKEFNIFKDKKIHFKNSPIIQEGQTALPFVTTRELEETRKYLRKINNGNIGINVTKNDDNYYLTLGGFQVITQPNMASVNTVNGNFTGYNTTYLSFNSYTTTKSTYFNSILDSNFNHVKGSFESTPFNKIKDYKSTLKYSSGEDVFFHKNDLFFGFFNQKESYYHLLKF